jgi:hypothetical protein
MAWALCWGRSGPGASLVKVLPAEARGSRLKSLVGGLGSSPTKSSEPFSMQAPTVLRIAPVDFPYTGRAAATNFKFEPPLPSPCRHRSSSLLIMALRGPLAGLTVRCRPMTNDGDSQEIAKQRGLHSPQARSTRTRSRTRDLRFRLRAPFGFDWVPDLTKETGLGRGETSQRSLK